MINRTQLESWTVGGNSPVGESQDNQVLIPVSYTHLTLPTT